MLQPARTEYAEFRDDFDDQFSRMSKAKTPTYVQRKGKTAAVVLSPKEFKAYATAREYYDTILAIDESMRQFEAGQGVPWEQAKKSLRKRLKTASPTKRRRAS